MLALLNRNKRGSRCRGGSKNGGKSTSRSRSRSNGSGGRNGSRCGSAPLPHPWSVLNTILKREKAPKKEANSLSLSLSLSLISERRQAQSSNWGIECHRNLKWVRRIFPPSEPRSWNCETVFPSANLDDGRK